MNRWQAHPFEDEETVDESIAAALRSPNMWAAALVIAIAAILLMVVVLVPGTPSS